MIDIKENHLYTTKEVAEYLKISITSVFKLIKKDKLRGLIIGRGYKITGNSILKFIEEI